MEKGEPTLGLLFKVSQGDFVFQADFAEPIFELFNNTTLQRQLFSKFARHGLRLVDIKAERGGGSLGEAQLNCWFFNFSTALRIWLERVEINCLDVTRVSPQKLKDLITGVLETAGSHFKIPFKTYGMALWLHGLLEGVAPKEFLSKFFTRAPNDLGPLLASGAVFYYGAKGEKVLSSLTVDLSAAIREGIFVRIQVTWNAEKVDSGELAALAKEHVKSALSQLGLRLDGGTGLWQ